MSVSNAQVPTIVASSIICLLIGIGGGAGTMYYLGYNPKTKDVTGEEGVMPSGDGKGGGMMGGKGGGMMGGRGGGGRGGGMMGGRGGGGPPGGVAPGAAMLAGMGANNPKVQLFLLISKLDQLTTKPLEVKLSDEQRAKLKEQLKGLAEEDELSDEDAKKRMDAMIDVVKDQKETLEAAGFRFPGAGGLPPLSPQTSNPFLEGDGKKHLEGLEKRLGKS